MLKLTLPDGRPAYFVTAHIASVVPAPDTLGGTFVTTIGEPEPYRVQQDADAIASRLARMLGVDLFTF